ncbi:hypothetical protein Tco_1526029 [Tanacetum coccineum]
MLLCKQEEAGFQLNTEQADWRDDTDDKLEDQELEAHYLYVAQIQEVTPDAANNSGPIFDAEPLQKVQNNDDNYNVFAIETEHLEQPESVNDTYLVEQDEHNIIIDSLDMSYDREHKNRNKFLETSNKALVDKLKGEIKDFKTKNKSLESSNNHFKEANNELSKTNQLMFKDLKKFQAELDRYHDVNYASKVEMVADLRYFNSLEHEVDSLKSQLETQKTQFLNEIDRLSRESYYADHMNAILGVYTTLDEFTDLQCDYVDQVVKCERLEKELSKVNITSKSFEALQQHAINLELALQQYLKGQLQDKGIAISELKKLIEKTKGKYVETKFEKPSVIRQPNAFKSQRQSILGVIPTTSVSRPQLKSNRLEDRVMHNNNDGKKQQVEDHHRNFKFSNNKTSVTACNDSLNAKTSNVNFFVLLVENLIEIIPFIVDSGCSKHMTRNLKLLSNFVEKFLGTVKFRNDQISSILGYGDLKSTCYIRDLKGTNLLTGSCGTDMYSITLQD